VPLLILKHDNPVDSGFIKSFYSIYFKVSLAASMAACISFAVAARPIFAVGSAVIAAIAWLLRTQFIPQMNALGMQIQAQDLMAIQSFRKIHKSAIAINCAQLLAMVTSLKWL
jgi:hypothetical protein